MGAVVLLREDGADLFDQTRRDDLRREPTERTAIAAGVPEEATARRGLVPSATTHSRPWP